MVDIEEMRKKATIIFLDKHYQKKGNPVYLGDISFYAWPQTFSSTNPFGCGGNAFTEHTIFAFLNHQSKDCVLFLLGKPQYRERFEPFIKYKV